MPSRDRSGTLVPAGMVFLAVNLLLYGVLIAARRLTSVLVVAVLCVLDLVCQSVRVDERIADGLEERSESR